QMYEAVTQLRYSLPALGVLEANLAGEPEHPQRFERPEPMGLGRGIDLVDVTFSYPGAEDPSLRGVNLTISKNSSVALVGSTGSGKTTIADLVLGLFSPTKGDVRVDGVALAQASVRAWQ